MPLLRPKLLAGQKYMQFFVSFYFFSIFLSLLIWRLDFGSYMDLSLKYLVDKEKYSKKEVVLVFQILFVN